MTNETIAQAEDDPVVVNLACSSGAPCYGMVFQNFSVDPPINETAQYSCTNVVSERGLPCEFRYCSVDLGVGNLLVIFIYLFTACT